MTYDSVADNLSYSSIDNDDVSIGSTLDGGDKVSVEPIRDSCYHKVKILRQNGKKKTIEFYETPCVVGAVIRNPITGIRMYGHKVGSRDEDLYFKVVFSGHPPAKNGTHNPCFLYYESPEQWEKHHSTLCPESIRDAWREKYNRALSRIIKSNRL